MTPRPSAGSRVRGPAGPHRARDCPNDRKYTRRAGARCEPRLAVFPWHRPAAGPAAPGHNVRRIHGTPATSLNRSATWNSTLAMPLRSALSRARCDQAASPSTATTWPARRASGSEKLPRPQNRSSTRLVRLRLEHVERARDHRLVQRAVDLHEIRQARTRWLRRAGGQSVQRARGCARIERPQWCRGRRAAGRCGPGVHARTRPSLEIGGCSAESSTRSTSATVSSATATSACGTRLAIDKALDHLAERRDQGTRPARPAHGTRAGRQRTATERSRKPTSTLPLRGTQLDAEARAPAVVPDRARASGSSTRSAWTAPSARQVLDQLSTA